MSIWVTPFTLADLTAVTRGTAAEHLGVRVTAFGDDWLEGTIPLDERTRSASGTLHAGALGILSETLGSIAASLCVDQAHRYCLGQILHVDHPEAITRGPLCGRATPLILAAHSHVWQIDIKDTTGARVCVAHLTMIILERRPASSS